MTLRSADTDNTAAESATLFGAADAYLKNYLPELGTKIAALLGGDGPFISELLRYAAGSGGKRVRPRFTMLAAATARGIDEKVIDVAACVECIHLATLMHDDVIDESPFRRGRPSVHRRFGNKLSILGGDYILTRVFQYLMRVINKSEVLEVLVATTNRMVVGEFLQLWRQGRLDVTEDEYLNVITLKSAKFMAASCELGAIVGGHGDEQRRALAEFGRHAGLSFQITDDYLDFAAGIATLGKEGYADIRAGKITLPVIHGLKSPSGAAVGTAIEAIWEGEAAEGELGRLLEEAGALEKTRAAARKAAALAKEALAAVPAGEPRELLAYLADWTWQRPF